jgi:hypothetical protein
MPSFGDMALAWVYLMLLPLKCTSLVGLAADLASFKNISIDQANTALSAIFTEKQKVKSWVLY